MDKSVKVVLIIGSIVVGVFIVVSAVSGAITGWSGQGWGMMGGGFGLGWFMPILMLIFWGLAIWGVIALVRGVEKPGSSPPAESALEILKKRYARGEISKEEYEAKKKDLV